MSFYSRNTTQSLKTAHAHMHRAASEPSPEFFDSAYGYDCYRGQMSEIRRRLGRIEDELKSRGLSVIAGEISGEESANWQRRMRIEEISFRTYVSADRPFWTDAL